MTPNEQIIAFTFFICCSFSFCAGWFAKEARNVKLEDKSKSNTLVTKDGELIEK